MTEDRRLRADCGSAVIEGVASMAAAFIMLTVLVQVSLAMSTRSVADAAVTAAARRAALESGDAAAETARLLAEVSTLIPAAGDVAASVEVNSTAAVARVAFRWNPPGPVLVPIRIAAAAEVPRAVPP